MGRDGITIIDHVNWYFSGSNNEVRFVHQDDKELPPVITFDIDTVVKLPPTKVRGRFNWICSSFEHNLTKKLLHRSFDNVNLYFTLQIKYLLLLLFLADSVNYWVIWLSWLLCFCFWSFPGQFLPK